MLSQSDNTVLIPTRPVYFKGVPLTQNQLDLKMAVDAAFADKPIMDKIAGCESSYRQFDASGKPLISDTDDVGVMQINLKSWKKQSEKMGLDIVHSSEDNIKMAQYVLKVQGVTAWSCYSLQ